MCSQLSQKGSFSAENQALTPASVSSLETSSQQPQSDTSTTNLEPKMEVKHQDEDEESDVGSCSKGGKLSNHKTEEKPIKSEFKKEDCSGEGGKGAPPDASATSAVKMEDRKPAVKVEVKEEEESSDGVTPQTPAKKKSESNISQDDYVKLCSNCPQISSLSLPLSFF